ncbi:YbfB/YjiJ family MFS transporter [Amycolatopsis thermophila]|uniref:MFS family arabinose efflux permease n=1 Tax=Amycolatopsis thermophila TaxID=206084 RepID=A0ABU0F255_9PSEU|nr:YbfB/YjiJ family MFS transporter [Amycolatopsis thermophila]MDQ0381661.1 putative MFS family arabinose efflux permease [Amycolatopsis thermophila]
MPGEPVWQAARLSLGTASALGFARFAYGLTVPAMGRDLGWSLADAGVMSTANGLGYLLGALVTAAVAGRMGTAAAFRWGMVLTALALAATAVSGNFAVLLVVRAVAGLTGAVVFIVGGVLASRIAARAVSGTPITVYFAGSGLGIVLSGAAIPALGPHWRLAWLGLGAVAAVAALVSWPAARVAGDGPAASTGRARVTRLWPVAVAYLLFALGYITYITFLSAVLAAHDATVAQVTLVWTALGVAVVVASAMWSGGRGLATLLAVLAAGSALALVSAALPVVLTSAVVYGATFIGVPAAVTTLIKDHTPPADWTATLGAFTTVFAAGQTAGPWLAGVVADRTTPAATVAWTAVLCAAGALVALIPHRGHR